MVERVLHKTFERILERVLESLKEHYASRLISVVVFGSVGRGTQRFDSDIDLLIVIEDLPRGRFARMREFEEIERKIEFVIKESESSGVYTELSPVLKTPEEVKRGSPLFLDMVYDSRILYDHNGFFAGFIGELKKRLETLGARRIKKGDAWYWDLKPDYRPGEIFEI